MPNTVVRMPVIHLTNRGAGLTMVAIPSFPKSTAKIRRSVYGVMGLSQIGKNQVNATNGTAFMIAPGILATAAHFVHVENNVSKPVHQNFQAIRAPDVGQPMEQATLVAEDSVRDVALLKIQSPRSGLAVRLESGVVAIGSPCGSLGFPLAQITFTQAGPNFSLVERFQGASLSAYHPLIHTSGRSLSVYETDALMYSGSSGCPGYVISGRIWGMHVSSVLEKPKQEGAQDQADRLSISLWVPAADIAAFARANRVPI